jgi:hypothetical protein
VLVVALTATFLLTLPSLSPAQLRWQYCLLVGPSSYHAFIAEGQIVIATGWSTDIYKTWLVDYFVKDRKEAIGRDDPGNPWNPTPAGGFTPNVTANDLQ